MRNALKLLLVAVAAVAALAFTAAPASAVEITEEGSGHCADVSIDGHDVVGGCRLAATSVGTVELRSLFGTMVNCNNQYEAAVDENGNGYLYNQSLTGTGCSVTPCTAEGEVTPWAINVTGTDPNYVMEADFCVVSSILGTINCHLTNVSVDPDGHDLANFAVNNGSGSHQFCEGSAINAVLGNWTAVSDASHPGLEISD